MECNDAQLVDRSQRGDMEAFRILIERHEKGVYNLAYRMLKNVEDAKDAAQEVFLKVFASLNGFRGESSFATWLYRIVANAAPMQHHPTTQLPKQAVAVDGGVWFVGRLSANSRRN